MDALSHNLEALCSPVFQPILDAIALEGIRFIKEWLPVAFHEGTNLHSRVFTMASSIMGAMAFEKGLGAMHALAHSVGGLFKTHHGRTVGALMPSVLLANRTEIEDKLVHVARTLDLPHHNFDAVLNWIIELRLELGLPTSLSELGVREHDIPAVVDNAMQDVNLATNPVRLSRTDLEALVARAL
jgi:alcohol dehydrogenase class IV